MITKSLSGLLLATGLISAGLTFPAHADNGIYVYNECPHRVKIGVERVEHFQSYFSGWYYLPGNSQQYLTDDNGDNIFHWHGKQLYYYAEEVHHSDEFWGNNPRHTITIDGEDYPSNTDNETDSDNDTPITLTCDN